MIAERFSALLAQSADDATVTGVLRWDISPPPGRGGQLPRSLVERKAPLLRRLADEGQLDVNDLPGLPAAVLTGPAARWRRVLRDYPGELTGPSVTLDANVEVPLTSPVRGLP